jgi:hypothetical protein
MGWITSLIKDAFKPGIWARIWVRWTGGGDKELAPETDLNWKALLQRNITMRL